VLEDNLRTPSGVSYVLENRTVTKRVFQHAMATAQVRRVDEYPTQLAETLRSVSPNDPERSTPVVLTPGPFNSAYFEHSFLARSMGLELVEASDLFVQKDEVFVRTITGPRLVDVIYRRTDDAFLDPEFFRPDSLLGVPGLMRAYAAGKVALVNAPGNGVADDKAVYDYVPRLIEYYLGERPLLEQVKTFHCSDPDQRAHVLGRLEELVVKPVDGYGGMGVVVGPRASDEELAEARSLIEEQPERWIAQETVTLSTHPTYEGGREAGRDGSGRSGAFRPRHVDLRVFVYHGREPVVVPAALTRVAPAGSMVVNSSRGGGAKDTWLLQ